jgi:hypothetical protein
MISALLPLFLLSFLHVSPVLAQKSGSFADAGDTLVSAMMMFLGNADKVYIIDKAEGNKVQVNGHPAWGSVWDINTGEYTTMDIKTNVFCTSCMHLPNGSGVTFGGNGAVGPGGVIGSQPNIFGSADFDATYQDFDGAKSIRILNPCTTSDNFADSRCQWFDNPAVLSMQKRRWYSAAEPLADGSIVLIGGFVNGGYVNRNFPNTDPKLEGGAAEPTYEFFPSRGPAQDMAFMTLTSGLNSYAHTFLMPSGKMFVQANISTILWDYNTNAETPLPDMPGKVARVYPASGAVAMLPLTPANQYTPTILFCGGSDMPSDAYGDYAHPAIDTFNYVASRDCQRITPEPTDGSPPVYVKDDEMTTTRTMGQFIALPDGTMLVINGANNGTAGYADRTGQTPLGQMPFGMSLASGPVLTPSIYNPHAPAGSRWSSMGLSASTIPRLYHSSAILLPDASVLVAGSNPNVDVNLTTLYPTTYKAEIFYPPYFAAQTRPSVTGVPKTLTYGGNSFDITIAPRSYSGNPNDAADKTEVNVVRGGFTTHAMNMGQRFLQLNNTYTVQGDGSIVLHVAQMPPNPNIFQPGPALLFVVIKGVPSKGTFVIVGNGAIGPQPVSDASVLPSSVRLDMASAPASTVVPDSTRGSSASSSKPASGVLIGIIVGSVAAFAVIATVVGVTLARRRAASSVPYTMKDAGSPAPLGSGPYGARKSGSSDNMPLQTGGPWNPSVLQQGSNSPWSGSTPRMAEGPNSSTATFFTPGHGDESDPYYQQQRGYSSREDQGYSQYPSQQPRLVPQYGRRL